jgi:hypothetical protein
MMAFRYTDRHRDLNDAVKTHEIIFAADRSAATGQPVRLPLVLPS